MIIASERVRQTPITPAIQAHSGTSWSREEVRLLEVTQGLAGELNLDILNQRIMSVASDLLDAERASLFVYDGKTHRRHHSIP